MILSDGVLVKSTLWEGTTDQLHRWPLASGSSSRYNASYAEMYTRQASVHMVVNKLAYGEARLPFKVYEHDDLNRPEANDSPYARLMAKPHPRMSRFFWWLWFVSTYDVYGEAFMGKIRDAGGRPIGLAPLHPTAMNEVEEVDGVVQWSFQNGKVRIDGIPDTDLVHPKTYNPTSTTRGLSRLEPLRRTLEFEDAAQRAQSSFWHRGARPGVALSHPGNISQPAAERLKLRWDQVAAGADKTGTTVVLEEGMKPEVMTVSNDDAQYIDSRKLNKEEVCGAYDVPPPAVHILDRATFSNITEQMRSLYRDTHAPRLKLFEDCLEAELRGSVRPGASEPDFGADVYGEFLLDEVLRGDFEKRADGFQKAVNSGWMTPAEVRQKENLPFVEGSDRLLINSTIVPLDQAESLDQIPPVDPATVRSVMGRIGRVDDVTAIDADVLTADLNGDAPLVRSALAAAVQAGDDMPTFKQRLKALAGGSHHGS